MNATKGAIDKSDFFFSIGKVLVSQFEIFVQPPLKQVNVSEEANC